MSFFKKFPRISYSFDNIPDGESLRERDVVDITKRVVLRTYTKTNQSLFIRYRMKEHESFETIAHKMYNNSSYHWVLMLLNEIVDPFYDIPLNIAQINNITNINYRGFSLFMKTTEYLGTFLVGEPVVAAIRVIDDNKNEILQDIPYTANAIEWDSTYRELVVTDETGTSLLTNTHVNDDVVIRGIESGAMGSFRRRIPHPDAVHHFEDSEGNILNPYDGWLGAYTEGSQLGGIVAVTNRQYEETNNDAKRNIRVIRPEYIEQLNLELHDAFAQRARKNRGIKGV